MGIPISNVPRRVVYAASGTGPYNFTFEILANTDIAVYRDDTLLTLTTNYTVTINPNGTGFVTLTASPTGATQIAIVGNRTISRSTDFTTGGDFFANTLNDELDQQTIFAQQNAEGLGRALQAPQTDPISVNMTLPRSADRAGRFLSFDSSGNPTVQGNIPFLYQGAMASDPFVRNDGGPLQAGDLYFNTADIGLRVYTGTAWVVAVNATDPVVERRFVATSGQTTATFTGGYRVGFLYVFVNGVMLDTTDITAVNGSTVVFATPLSLNDEVRMLTFKSAASIPDLPNGGGELGLRNFFINGNFQVRQRGQSFTPVVGGINYTADRWYYTATGAAPAGTIGFESLGRVNLIAINGALGLTKLVIGQRIESLNHFGIYNVPLAVSFAAYPGSTRTVTVQLRIPSSAADDFSSTTTVASASVTIVGGTLNTYSVTFPQTSLSNVHGLEVVFDFGAVGDGDIVRFGRAQIEKSDIVFNTPYITTFEYRPFGLELSLCQRYLPAWNGTFSFAGSAYSTSTTQATGTIAFPVETRVPPTGITVSNAGHFRYNNATSNYVASGVSFVSSSTKNGRVNLTVSGVASANLPGIIDCNNASGQLLFTGCEL